MTSAPWHFIAGYFGAALWSSTDDNGEPLDSRFDMSDLAPATRRRMEADCHEFYAANHRRIHCEDAPMSREFEGSIAAREAAMAGHDFWLNRNGHGAGFWDGDWPEPDAAALTKAAESFGNVDLYIGDDGRIYA